MSRVPLRPTAAQARAKATELADQGGPDGKLHPADRDRYIAHLTPQFLEMELEEFNDY